MLIQDKNDNVIEATEKAYEVIYKPAGFVPAKPKKVNKNADNDKTSS